MNDAFICLLSQIIIVALSYQFETSLTCVVDIIVDTAGGVRAAEVPGGGPQAV